ncbi:MAG: hypothetical protein FVQ79_00545 [Planctomycetes bacterium]|nr:hypothetical protein [Planctomycetota bacterium]
MNIDDIEELTHEHAEAREALTEIVNKLESQVRAAKMKHRTALIQKLSIVRKTCERLSAAIEENSQLFQKPRTRIFHNIKVGMQKGKGKLNIPSLAKTLAKIKQLYDDESGVLINVKESINKKAVSKLSADALKKIGITISNTSDEVLIKTTDTDIDKLVDAFLNDGEEEGNEAA